MCIRDRIVDHQKHLEFLIIQQRNSDDFDDLKDLMDYLIKQKDSQ